MYSKFAKSLALYTVLTATAWASPDAQQPLVGHEKPKRPNIVFILSDDQDLHMGSWEYMPLLKQHLIDEGLSFRHHYCTNALCCPSRVSLWTGKAAHNTNVTDVNPPYGTLIV
jgi:N-acetylglucosamine-6-sulfatase